MDEPNAAQNGSDGSEPEPLTWRDWARPLFAIVLGFLFFAVFGMDSVSKSPLSPGIGVTAFVWAFFAAVLAILGKRTHWSAPGALLTAAALTLSLSCGLWSDPFITVGNCFVILPVSAMAVFSLSGQASKSWRDIAVLPETVKLSVMALFTKISKPFDAVRQQGKKGALGGIVLGIVIAVPVLAAVIGLLSSADQVFGGLFSDIGKWFDFRDIRTALWHIVRALALALFLCSGLYFISGGAPKSSSAAPRPEKEAHNAALIPLSLLLDAVYALFVVIQIEYLFGGREAAAMAGGWAEYARSGFFQLVAVTALNLVICSVFSSKRRFSAGGGLLLRILYAWMLGCTSVILASAFWRMRLYILAFGLSLLRLATLWAMLVIAVCILAAAWKLYKPTFHFWAALFAFGLASWCLLCLACPDNIIANYNVNAYLDGKLQQVDTEYLGSLSPDTLPALVRLRDAEGGDYLPQDAIDDLNTVIHELRSEWSKDGPWTCWRFSLVRIR
jgi:hypothetical protein